MVHVRMGFARRSWIEVPACAREIRRIAAANGVDVYAVRARRYALKVVHDLYEATVRHLEFVELDGPGNFLARDFGRRLLNHILVDGDSTCRCTGRAAAICTASTALSAAAPRASSSSGRSRCLSLCRDESGCHAQCDGECNRLCCSHE